MYNDQNIDVSNLERLCRGRAVLGGRRLGDDTHCADSERLQRLARRERHSAGTVSRRHSAVRARRHSAVGGHDQGVSGRVESTDRADVDQQVHHRAPTANHSARTCSSHAHSRPLGPDFQKFLRFS